MANQADDPPLYLHDLKRKIVDTPSLWGKEAGIDAISTMTRNSAAWSSEARKALIKAGFITPTLPQPSFTQLDEAWYDAKTSMLSSLEAIAAVRCSYIGLGPHLQAFHTHLTALKAATAQANTMSARSIVADILKSLFVVADLKFLAARHQQIGSEAYLYAWSSRGAVADLAVVYEYAEQLVEAIMERNVIAGEFAMQMRTGAAGPLDRSALKAG